MSVERVQRAGGPVYRVRWRCTGCPRHPNGGPHSHVTGSRKRDAEAVDAEIRRRKRLGEVIELEQPKPPLLHEFVTETWWPNYAMVELAHKTRLDYASAWNVNIRPVLGGVRLTDIGRSHIDGLRAHMNRKGLADLTQRHVIYLLQGIIGYAIELGLLVENPVTRVKKPPKQRKRRVRPLTPEAVEAIRAELPPHHAVKVSFMAYTGIRPVEWRKLEWADVSDSVHVAREVAKNRKPRRVPLFEPVQLDLKEWRLASEQGRWLFPNARGDQASSHVYNRWAERVFSPAAKRAGIECVPYDLRHSFVSLLIQAGYQILEVARLAGHLPQETLGTYGHLFEEYDPTEQVDPTALIQEARAA